MRRILTTFSILLVVGLYGFLSTAHAATTLTLSDGSTTITVQDGGGLDAEFCP